MNTAAAIASTDVPFGLTKIDPHTVAFIVTSATAISIKAGTVASVGDKTHSFDVDTAVAVGDLAEGVNYDICIMPDGKAIALVAGLSLDALGAVAIGGFHFAPGGNAAGTDGGDDVPAINPFSCWDLNFRPACADPRGMALIDGKFWCDIYLTAAEHDVGTSLFGVTIADGRSLPKGHDRFDYEAAKAVLAGHGKQLLGAEEFFAAAYGVKERTSADSDPKVAGLDAQRTSQHGIMQATGNLWVWGTDGHPDEPRASRFGGSWFDGSDAGSRYASLGYSWPGHSGDRIGARGRCDHLILE